MGRPASACFPHRAPRLVARAILLAAVAAPALPSLATTLTSTGTVIRTAATTALVQKTPTVLDVGINRHDRLLGVTWAAGNPRVEVRWHAASGWSAWSALDNDTGTPTTTEAARARAGTEPAWLPSGVDHANVRMSAPGAPATGVRVVVVADTFHRTLTGLHAGATDAEASTGTAALGHVYTRRDWHADESMRRCSPDYARTNVAVVVHHTAQTNSYSASDVPGMIRADYAYHVQSRGWCDIGYNLLVDRFGRIWEGRYGGIGRAVIGAHAEGFNTGTVGVSYLGSTDHYAPSAAAIAAFTRVAIYAATTWHFDPSSSVVMTSGGSPRYAAGRHVRLNRVMGHRDTGLTDCPGTYLYSDLGRIRSAAHDYIYVPHFTTTAVYGTPVHAPKPANIWLGLDRTAHWAIVLKDRTGNVVASASGTGRVAHLSWDGVHKVRYTGVRVPTLPQNMHWLATAYIGTARAHPASGSFAVSTPVLGPDSIRP
jgi:uncharacterized protein with LGFP repeats